MYRDSSVDPNTSTGAGSGASDSASKKPDQAAPSQGSLGQKNSPTVYGGAYVGVA